jgi:hypothetical protein
VIVKEAYGGQLHQPNTELANTIKGACSDGLKKAASLLGIGIDLYRHDDAGKTAGSGREAGAGPVAVSPPWGQATGNGLGNRAGDGSSSGGQRAPRQIREAADLASGREVDGGAERRDYSWFWSQTRRLGLTASEVHARLGVRNLRELEEQGHTLTEILATLQATSDAA